MVPNKELNEMDEDDVDSLSGGHIYEHKPFEMSNLKSPANPTMVTPFTPRTQAFHALNRQMPLRAKQESNVTYFK